MKIICIGRNYADHAKELKSEIPTQPVIFLKPDTAMLRENAPFYYPNFSKQIDYEVELVVKITKEGKNIDQKFSKNYYDQIAVGIDFTARDLQNQLKAKGLPWEISKGFNGSAALSQFISIADLPQLDNIKFSLNQNEVEKQAGNSHDMIFGIDYLISYISTYYTLKKGDLIYTGTPAGVGAVQIGDEITCFLEGNKLLTCEIK